MYQLKQYAQNGEEMPSTQKLTVEVKGTGCLSTNNL